MSYISLTFGSFEKRVKEHMKNWKIEGEVDQDLVVS
jgi:hypothetical protein